MTKLKLGAIPDDKPIKVTVELPAALHRDLVTYAELLSSETGPPIADPVRPVDTMIARYISTYRIFAR